MLFRVYRIIVKACILGFPHAVGGDLGALDVRVRDLAVAVQWLGCSLTVAWSSRTVLPGQPEIRPPSLQALPTM